MANKDNAKQWFQTGDYPTQEQFYQVFDWVRWKDEGISIADIANLQNIINSLQNTLNSIIPNTLVSGGNVSLAVDDGSTLSVFLPETKYKLKGVPFTQAAGTFNLSLRPVTAGQFRIDVFYLDNTGFHVVTGVVSDTPIKPASPEGSLELSNMLIGHDNSLDVAPTIETPDLSAVLAATASQALTMPSGAGRLLVDGDLDSIGFAPNLIFKTKTTIPTVLSTKANLEAAINDATYQTSGVVKNFKILAATEFGATRHYINANIEGKWVFSTEFLKDNLDIIEIYENTLMLYMVAGSAFKGCTSLERFTSYSPQVQTGVNCFDTHYETAYEQNIIATDFIVPYYAEILGTAFYATPGLLTLHGYYIGYVGPNDPGVDNFSRIYLSRVARGGYVTSQQLDDAIDAVNNNIPSDVGNDIFNYYNFS